jgi:hypothetical protein
MLSIRNAQLEVLSRHPRLRFEAELAGHLRRYFPHECARGDVGRFVRLGIDRAEYHGCETQRDVALYLSLMAMLGSDFDRDPQIPWAGTELDDPSIPTIEARLSKVYDSALAYLEEIGGHGNCHLVRAGLRIRGYDMGGLSPADADDLPAVLVEFLTGIYPEKARRQGESAMEELVNLAIESARTRGAKADRATAIHALHMFMLGSGYDCDPLYGWLNGVLDDRKVGPVELRFDIMLKASVDYLEVTLRKQAREP